MNPTRPAGRRVLVVGAGPAGAVAAIALARAGSTVDIVEIREHFDAAGVGVLLQNAPLRALHALGLAEAVCELGFPHGPVHLADESGTVQHTSTTVPLVASLPPAVAVGRAELARLLGDAALAAGAGVRFGTTVTTLRENVGAVEAVFSDDSAGEYDLVIGADGIHSRTRDLVFAGAPRPSFAGQRIWRVDAERPEELREYIIQSGPHGKVGLVAYSPERAYLYLLENAERPSPRPEGDLRAQLRARLEPFGGMTPVVAAGMSGEVDVRDLHFLLMPLPWRRGRVVLIGDAAHATTPQISYGLGLAVEDGIVLTEELSRGVGVPAALDTFGRRRFTRARDVVESSLQLSRWEQHPPDDPAAYGALLGRTLGALTAPI